MIKKGWIALYDPDERRKTYLITDKGKEILEKEVGRLKQNLILGQQIMKGGRG